ncbi:tyrosine-type recombinase/integrase [Halovivax gelatinilyticus]|uniref:tyrosine-type recombinase/integrase n=1 Tax=Halovivax gelatinilyticus TaxID=2961597 RepID=UPI0020CA6F60|nr:recombinase XerD [Halovivax gelatinilyticus]
MIPLDALIERYLERKSVGSSDGAGAGTYASNASSILTRWTEWLDREYDVTTVAELETAHCGAYARELNDRTRRGEYAASSAHTYFAVVRAFLSWCVDEAVIRENPAEAAVVVDALPEVSDTTLSQHWSADARRELESYVETRASEAEEGTDDRLARLREYAMVALLAHAGLRGGELFRVPEDDRRTGATWDDVDFYAGTIQVLGTSQQFEDVPLPAAARTPLRRYRIALDPPTNDWPLFPTRHAPSIASTVRTKLTERGYGSNEIDALFDDHTAIELAHEHAISPAAITTEGARTILKRLCEEADVDVGGDYLKPVGARRAFEPDAPRTVASGVSGGLRTSVLEQSLVTVDEDESTGTEN